MKHLKMLGLAAIAALGLMAFVGAGTASATTLCTSTKVVEDEGGVKTTVCNVGYGVGTELHSTLKSKTSATLEKTNGELIATCTESTVKGSLGTATGTWVSGKISSLTWGGCSQTTTSLVSEEVEDEGGVKTKFYGSLEIMQTTGDAGTVVGRNSNVTLSVFGVSCTYGTGEGTTLGTITGGAAPELVINAILPRTAGSTLFCPSSGRWTATYIVTSPHEVHIVS